MIRRAFGDIRLYLASAYYKLSQTARLAGDTAKATQYLEQFTRVRESPLSETIELPRNGGDLSDRRFRERAEAAVLALLGVPDAPAKAA